MVYPVDRIGVVAGVQGYPTNQGFPTQLAVVPPLLITSVDLPARVVRKAGQTLTWCPLSMRPFESDHTMVAASGGNHWLRKPIFMS